jgi:hypothetical protein
VLCDLSRLVLLTASLRARAEAEGDDAAGVGLGARELEVLVVAFGEEVGALPEDERVHVEDVLVDEACGGHRLDELAAAPHEDAAVAT